MKLGYHGFGVGATANAGAAARVARHAEDLGYESLWTAEHVVLPSPRAPPSPAPPETPLLDPAGALCFAAGLTTRIRLATGIIILPQRNPLVLAKELTTVDVLSSGRLIFGIGVGYLKPEFDALGIPFDNKGPRSDEYLEAIVALWTQPRPSYSGRFASFAGIDAQPRPVQKPHPPIVIGGHSPGAFRRAVRYGNGWYGYFRDVEGTRQCLAGLAAAASEVERPAGLGPLEISITPPLGFTADDAKAYADLGVDRLIPGSTARSGDALVDFLSSTAEKLTGVCTLASR
jgi:probable F420-dependent oxidoreductase